MPPTLATLTMAPLPLVSMVGISARIASTTPRRLTFMTLSNCSIGISGNEVRRGVAALLTAKSRWPNSLRARSTTAWRRGLGHGSASEDRSQRRIPVCPSEECPGSGLGHIGTGPG